MNDQKYDVIVIGTGPGGEGAAMKAAKDGKAVAVIEKHHLVGGGCTHWGTIPSKALRHSINRMLEFNTTPAFRSALGTALKLSYPDLLRSAESVI
ncbi:MAG TPA: FAD-dependent oxidoreductase, partial [Candidatus Competibacteraceae bacterium]|nr:FAD-dependent oxidoreductase [Candidatus Competibacteraceae bacterium]